jgi:SAM-dependent methyltransferase
MGIKLCSQLVASRTRAPMRLCCSCGKPFDDSSWQCPSCLYEPKMLDGHLAFAPELAEKSEGFESDYFGRLADLEAGSFWFRSRNRLLCWALKRYFPDAKSFFEIGCGTGFVLTGIRRELPRLNLAGSEVFSKGLSFAAERLPGVDLFQMDARRIPFVNEFDVIGAFDVLEHIFDDELVLSQMHQAVRKGGGILVTVPQHSFLWSEVDEYSRHVRRYSVSELKAKVRRAGFKILRTTSFVSLLLPLMLMVRLKRRSSNKRFDPTAEFQLSAPANFVLKRAMDVERAMIRLGVSFPAGGSLLLAATRSAAAQ